MMKQIINNRKYDTGTAEFISETTAGSSIHDFHYIEESLYRKKTGEFFTAGEGGAATKYSVDTGNGCVGGHRIIPLTEQEARTWIEANENDIYEDVFGPVEE